MSPRMHRRRSSADVDLPVGTRQSAARLAGVALALCLAVTIGGAVARPRLAAAQGGVGEYDVKAAFLLNFARLIEWPSAAFPLGDSPLVVCVLGNDPFYGALHGLADGKSVGTRIIAVKRLAGPQQASDCHLVFVTEPPPVPLGPLLAATSGRSVLLVGDAEDFAARGGAISFYHEGGKVRFAVNRGAAEAAGLKISSRMLRLAKLVPDDTSAMPLPRSMGVAAGATGSLAERVAPRPDDRI